MAQLVKNLPTLQETGFNPRVGKIPWRRERLPTLVFLAWRIPWTIQYMGSQRVRHDWVTFTFTFQFHYKVKHISNPKAVNFYIYLKDIKTNVYQRTFTSTLKAILLIIAMKWNSNTKKQWINHDIFLQQTESHKYMQWHKWISKIWCWKKEALHKWYAVYSSIYIC